MQEAHRKGTATTKLIWLGTVCKRLTRKKKEPIAGTEGEGNQKWGGTKKHEKTKGKKWERGDAKNDLAGGRNHL